MASFTQLFHGSHHWHCRKGDEFQGSPSDGLKKPTQLESRGTGSCFVATNTKIDKGLHKALKRSLIISRTPASGSVSVLMSTTARPAKATLHSKTSTDPTNGITVIALVRHGIQNRHERIFRRDTKDTNRRNCAEAANAGTNSRKPS